MISIQVKNSVLMVMVFLVGCSYPQNKVLVKTENQDKILFDGAKIRVIESVQSNLEQNSFDSKENAFCFEEIDKEIKNNFSSLNFSGNNKYFKIEIQKNIDSDPDKFILNLSREQSTKINPDFFKKLDTFAGYISDTSLYFLKTTRYEYLIMIGKPLGATGIGVYYWNYLVIPLDSNKQIVEIGSVSNNPKTVKIDEVGMLYYTQIDENFSSKSAVKYDSGSKYFPLNVSLFSFDGVSNKKFEFAYNCKISERH